MKFIIEDYSACCDHVKSHKSAFIDYVPMWEERTCSIEEFDKKHGDVEGLWLSKGRLHYESKKDDQVHCFRRLNDVKKWCIDVEDLNSLIKLTKDESVIRVVTENKHRPITTIILNDCY